MELFKAGTGEKMCMSLKKGGERQKNVSTTTLAAKKEEKNVYKKML